MSAINPILITIGDAGCVVEKDINFYDYDGTLIASYELAELPLSSLPDAPDHSTDDTPLTFEEYNYTLSEINATNGKLDVGAIYNTTSGKTEAYLTMTLVSGLAPTIYFEKSDTSTLTLELRKVSDNSLVWSATNSGSGIQSETVSGLSEYIDYRLDTWISTGTGTYTFGNGTSATSFITNSFDILKKVFIGNNVINLKSQSFRAQTSLKFVSLNTNITLFDFSFIFAECYSLKCIIIPRGVTSFGGFAGNNCDSCHSLIKIILPSEITQFGTGNYAKCHSLTNMIASKDINTIQATAFIDCYSIIEYDFSNHTAIPTLSNINAFTGINDICKIKVPSALYASWIIATNWSTYADYIEAV